MEQQKLNIDDGSGDRDYFTIIPNYILNHSTAYDQALYLQLKRLAGDGKRNYCYPSLPYLRKQLKIGYVNLKKSFKYLIESKWIDYLGKRRVKTAGGYQWVNSYKINDIWKLNTEHYQGCSKWTNLEENKDTPENTKGSLEISKGSPVIGGKERTIKERTIKERTIATPSVASSEINLLIEKFKPINPSYEQLFKDKTQRVCLERLVKQHGREKVENMIKFLPQIFGKPYAPRISTPFQLEKKLADLMSYIQQEKSKGPKFIKI